MTAILSYRTCVYLYVYEVAMQKNALSLGVTIMTKIPNAHAGLIFVKAQKSGRKEFDPVCFQRHIIIAISIMM